MYNLSSQENADMIIANTKEFLMSTKKGPSYIDRLDVLFFKIVPFLRFLILVGKRK